MINYFLLIFYCDFISSEDIKFTVPPIRTIIKLIYIFEYIRGGFYG